MKINDRIDNINEYATDLINSSREYYTLIENMYESIKRVNDSLDISEESSFKKLLQSIISQKNIYTNYSTSINRLGNNLLDYSMEIRNILTEKGMRGNSIQYDGDKMSNDVTYYLPDAKRFILSANNCANEFNIDFDCGQNMIKEEIAGIINLVNEFENWNTITKTKYNNALTNLKSNLRQTRIEQIRRRNSSINTIWQNK